MIKKLIQHGNSAALIIDRPIMELLHLDMETPVEISSDGKNLIISPARDESRRGKFTAALERVNARHGKTLKKLAQ